MFANPWSYLIVIAVLIVASLAFYAIKLLRQLKKQTAQQAQAEQERQRSLNQHDKKILDSIVIIVRAMKEEQCDISEGCWRLSVLLDSLKTSENHHQQFPAIFELYEAIKHMPILEARKKLEKRERMKLDFERVKIEARLADAVKENVNTLHQYAAERVADLT
ncbi:DUF2489 domain-containing protein [Thalassotalea castellviae]|uniref:DUF2489 domain-containing protein n=1 Tax=Thalassotalea castellviae TaxID=3075612 RepID=A0ABU3A1T5_9GAMM|nr:DUF2489 domain-containing protein [Thalassotalea sp. W431]MDT0603843.1 DUF2489 domain-containing protein [Thalassotalea sp. W431]